MEPGVYIHFPFCVGRCGYCDFYSTTQPVPRRAYGDAVLAELDRRAAELPGRPGSVYVGGGTPSLWDGDDLARVLHGIAARYGVELSALEVTLELNPGTASRRTMARLARAGVNRVSIGLQAMTDGELELLGRRHHVADAERAVGDARAAGLRSVSCDLILGLPGQPVERHLDSLRRLLDLEPDHVSVYALTLGRETALHRRGMRPVDDDVAAEMMERGREMLEQSGLRQYEVSNYAREGHRCRHNCGVWRCWPYLGLGAGAHSLRLVERINVRRANPPLKRYLERAPAAVEVVDESDARFEMVFLGLRTVEGVDREGFGQRFGMDPVTWLGDRFGRLVDQDLLDVSSRFVRPTRRGIWFADDLAVQLCR